MADVRFGRGFVQSATNPAYTQGLFDLGQQIGSYDRRQREKAAQVAVSKGMMNSVIDATNAISTGEINVIDEADASLQGLSASIKDPELIRQVNDARILVAQARVDARPKHIENKARALNDINRSIASVDEQLKGLTGEDSAFEGLTVQKARLRAKADELSENADVAIKAAEIDFNTRLAAISQENQIGAALETQAHRKLSSMADLNSDEAQEIRKSPGGGPAYDRVLKERAELQKAVLEAEDTKSRLGKLEDSELDTFFERYPDTRFSRAQLKAMRPKDARDLMANVQVETAKTTAQLERNKAIPQKAQAKAIARTVLEHVRTSGAVEYVPLPFDYFRDIEDKIDNMSTEEREAFISDFDGNMGVQEIVDTAIQKLKGLFPRQMEDYLRVNNMASIQEAATDQLFNELKALPENKLVPDEEIRATVESLLNPQRVPNS